LCIAPSNIHQPFKPPRNRSPDPPPLGAPRRIGQGARFHAFTTRAYKLHFLESPSGLKVCVRARAHDCLRARARV
jgi:hypothetical protein